MSHTTHHKARKAYDTYKATLERLYGPTTTMGMCPQPNIPEPAWDELHPIIQAGWVAAVDDVA